MTRKRKNRKVEEENKAIDKTKNTGRKKKDRKDKKARKSGKMTKNEKTCVVKEYRKLVCFRQKFESFADQKARVDRPAVERLRKRWRGSGIPRLRWGTESFAVQRPTYVVNLG